MAQMKTKMTMPGAADPMDWETLHVLGYDNVTKKYQSMWLDTMGTGMYLSQGTADASGRIMTLEGTMKDGMTPDGRPFKVVINLEKDDTHVTEMWDAIDGKDLVKMGTVTETRKK